MMDREWVVYYDDDTRADSEKDPWDIPRVGVQAVVQRNPQVGYELLRTVGDYFVYDPDRGNWRITDLFGVYDHLITTPRPVVLFGRQMEDKAFEALIVRVKEECGHKNAWLLREKKPLD